MPTPLTAEQHDRAVGVLLGTAAGDALGAGYEFSYPSSSTPIAMIGGGPFGWEPGEWTDDTAMTIAIAQSLAAAGPLHREEGLDAVAARFIEWFDSRPKDIGNQTYRVLSARSATAREMQTVAERNSARGGGNGSLMRTAPVALGHLDDVETCARAAELVSNLTHPDPEAAQACILWTVAVRHAVLHGTYDGLRTGLGFVDPIWETRLHQAETGSPKDFPKNGWVVHALQTAWWAITHADNLPDALELAVRAGHDTDTTAAIAGALLGAKHGASAIPAEWVELLHGYPGLRAADLRKLTDEIVNAN